MAILEHSYRFVLPVIARLLQANGRLIREELSIARALMPQRIADREQRLAAIEHAINRAARQEQIAKFVLQQLGSGRPYPMKEDANGIGRSIDHEC